MWVVPGTGWPPRATTRERNPAGSRMPFASGGPSGPYGLSPTGAGAARACQNAGPRVKIPATPTPARTSSRRVCTVRAPESISVSAIVLSAPGQRGRKLRTRDHARVSHVLTTTPPLRLATAIVATALALLAGLGDAAPASGALKRITFGDSARGTKLRAVRLGDPDATRKVLVVGSIHGDESEGHEIVRRLRRSHRDTPAVQLWVVTSVNPDGVQAGTRKNAHGVDLNRNFSYRWRGGVSPSSGYYPGPHPFSEPESRAVRRLARRLKPRVTIWYHQPWGQVLAPCDGPARKQKRYARLANLPLKRCRGQRLRGTATSWQNHRLPGTAFVVELPGGELPSSAARRHARAAAKLARSGGGRRKLRSGGSRQRRDGRSPGDQRRSREAAQAAHRPRPDPLRPRAKAPDGRLLGAPLRAAPVAPSPSAGDRPALHGRAQLQVGVGDVRLQCPKPR